MIKTLINAVIALILAAVCGFVLFNIWTSFGDRLVFCILATIGVIIIGGYGCVELLMAK